MAKHVREKQSLWFGFFFLQIGFFFFLKKSELQNNVKRADCYSEESLKVMYQWNELLNPHATFRKWKYEHYSEKN